MPENFEKNYHISNKFGLSINFMPEKGQYDLLFKGRKWLGNGIISVFKNGRWYRSQTSYNLGIGFEDGYSVKDKDEELGITEIRQGTEEDVIGSFEYIDCKWEFSDKSLEFITSFRVYKEKPHVVFVERFPKGFKNYANGNWTQPSMVFPQFSLPSGGSEDIRDDLYSWTSGGMFNHRFGYGNAGAISGAVDILVLADKDNNAMILSPFANYLAATQQCVHLGGKPFQFTYAINCGIQGLASEIPEGYEHMHIVTASEGINNTFRMWGDALLSKSGKKRPSKYEDDSLKYIAYLDDYGAYYWSKKFTDSEYDNYEDIIIAVEEELKNNGIRTGVYHVLDSDQLKYKEGLYEPLDSLFPRGVKWLSEKIGRPIQAYMCWLASKGPYREKFPYFDCGADGDVPLASMGDVFYSEDYWEYTAEKLASWGCISLMIDYINIYEGDKVMMSGINNMDIYFKNMAKALHKKGISIHYCMQMPRHVMESVENPAMLSLQGTWDHHVLRNKFNMENSDSYQWKHLIFTNAFYGSLGIWPSRDNIQTVADANAYEDVLVANLSGGQLQLGHKVGECDFSLLKKTYRECDGLVLKADRPITPIDRCYIEGGMVGYTESNISGHKWYYVLSLPSSGYLSSFSVADLGGKGKYLVYNYEMKCASVKSEDCQIPLLRDAKHEYFVVAPVFDNGMAVIGDTEKFVTMADMRVASVETCSKMLKVGVISGLGDNPIITGYSPTRPSKIVCNGEAMEETTSLGRLRISQCGWFWDSITKLWHVKMDFSDLSEIVTREFIVAY
ncbi:MAG TPA: hypothetical protein GXX14_03155 [Clostridiaceae bacterium]|nr:hypothetical protein [Clostridiaceae bacterium]